MPLASPQRERKPEAQAGAAARRPGRPASSAAPPGVAGRVVLLQHACGNQVLQRLLQRKPLVSEPGDASEREADRVAEEVTALPAPESAPAGVNAFASMAGGHIPHGTSRLGAGSGEGGLPLARELVPSVQQGGARILRRAGPDKDDPRGLGRKLPPRKPARAPRSTGLPMGVTPCLSGTICEPPIPGSAWDFGKKAEKESTARPKQPALAKEVKKAAEASSPGVLKEIFQVTVNPGLSADVAAQVDTCKNFNVSAPSPTASCMEVPTELEQQAARFNQGKPCMDMSQSADRGDCLLDGDFWKTELVETMTHEAAHIAFERRTPVGISSRTKNEITLHELSEMFAQFSEFPIHYREVQNTVSHFADRQEAGRAFQTSMRAWVRMHAESKGEGFRGMLTKLRCINDCPKVNALIASLVESATAKWLPEIKTMLLQELRDAGGLDWPMPAADLRPLPPAHPKMPPLYQPRGSFTPEIEKSTEDLP